MTEEENLCYCQYCHYTFDAAITSHLKDEIPDRCPDCGKIAVRPATTEETKEYYRVRAEIEAEDVG